MSYVKDDFLLDSNEAKTLYFDYAKDMPIFDYHCHLQEKEILANKQFEDIFELWLKYDHYKWRLMRNYGIDEEYITGNAEPKEKFMAYCKALSTAFGNPLYHWSQVELKEYFDCELEINEKNASAIWDICNAYIKDNNLKPSDVIEKSNVKKLYTTNEVFDDLSTFEALKGKYSFEVAPAYRADKIMNIEAKAFCEYIAKLQEQTLTINSLDSLEKALEIRLCEFVKVGATACDIALQSVLPVYDKSLASVAFEKRISGEELTSQECDYYKGYLTAFLMKLYHRYNLVVEVHIGAMRNNNSLMLARLGLDTGFDSIAEDNSIANLSRLLDTLNSENCLPKTIIFNLNPKMNVEIMTLVGCFQDSSAKGKIQYGAAWWFLDNKVGMEKHLKDMTSTGHIGTFVGMLTDSRSFLSYPRHHYFRRILCSYLGNMMAKGEITRDMSLVGKVVQDVSYLNARDYFAR